MENKGEIAICETVEGTDIQVKLDKDTVWLDAHLLAKIFNVNRPAVVKHIKNIYKSGELHKKSTCSILEQIAGDGKRRKMNLYHPFSDGNKRIGAFLFVWFLEKTNTDLRKTVS